MPCRILSVIAAVLMLTGSLVAADTPVRIGMIGLDSYHSVAFAQIWNNPKNTGDLAGVRATAIFPAGSPDIPESVEGLGRWPEQIRKFGVEIVGSLDDLFAKSDIVVICSVDGRAHLAQARAAAKAGKPFFVDRPLAASLADAVKIFDAAREAKVPCFSCSQHRFSPGFIGMRNHPELGKVLGADVYGGCPRGPFHPDLYWHGVHGVETLYTIMGPGCVSVTRAATDLADVVTGTWADGRVGVYRGIRQGAVKYSAVVFGEKAVLPAGVYGYGVPEKGNEKPGRYMGYESVAIEIAKFAKTRTPPVTEAETLEVFSFLEAAEESKRRGGTVVKLADVLEAARK